MSLFRNRFKYAMQLRNLKPSEVVEYTHIGKSSISQWLNGQYEPKQDKVNLIANTLKVNKNWLAGYNQPMLLNENKLVKENNELKKENERLRKKN